MRTLATILVLLAAGCANSPVRQPTDAETNVGAGLAGAWGHAESATYDIQQARDHSKDDSGIHFIDAGLAELKQVFARLTDSINGETLARTECGKEHDARQRLESELAAERDQWFGDKTHRLVGWIIGILTGGAVLLLALHILAGGTLLSALPFSELIKGAWGGLSGLIHSNK